MKVEHIKYLIYLILISSLFFTIYNLITKTKLKKIIKFIVEKSTINEKERSIEYEKLYEEFGILEKVNLKRKIDIYLIRSGLKEKFPFINADIFILISILVSVVTFIITMLITRVFIISVGIALIMFLLFMLYIYILNGITYEKIDNQLILFLNLLENFSTTTDDIVSIFQESSQYLSYPLNKYCEEFVTESKMTGNVRIAFSNFEDKIENERLKDIIRNIEISSRNDANYKEVLGKSKDVIKGYFESKESKRSIKRSGQMDICISAIMGLVVILVMNNLIPNLKYDLINTTIGNIILTYWMFVIVICVSNFIVLQKN